jgi:hypothetical protein
MIKYDKPQIRDIMKEAGIDIRKYRKGDIYVDSFTGQSKMEVLEANHKVKLLMTWFDPCAMDWKSYIVSTDQDSYFIETHFRPILVKNKKEEEILLKETNNMIKEYRKLYGTGTKNRCKKI